MLLKNNKELSQKDFKNEKELQAYFEKNLKTILNLQFVDTEFTVGNFRIDSLAFDEELKAFRIIEYKNVKNHSLVDQGYTYLKLLLERKADFVLQYNIKTKASLTIQDIDWSQSRILFVSPIYTQYQLNATDFKNIPVDLIRVSKYEDDLVEVTFIKKTSTVKVEEIKINESQDIVEKEVKVYTEDDHLSGMPSTICALYEELKNKILELDDIDVDVKKKYIAFKGKRNIVDLELYKSHIKVNLNVKKGQLQDPYHIAEDISSKGHYGNGDYRVSVYNQNDIDDVIPLVKQSLKINKK